MVKNVWERTCLDRYLDHLKAIQIALREVNSTNLVDTKSYGPQRNLHPEWKKKSDANRFNRVALPDVMLHTRGSINLGEHKKRMVNFVSHTFYLLVEFHMHYALSTCANV